MQIALMNGTQEQARAQGDWSKTVFFDASGFRVTHLALIDGEAIETIELPEPVDCREGDIPVVRNKNLICAKPVSMAAEITDKVDADLTGRG